VDLDAHLTEKLLASVAVRGEHYSDFGSNVSGKLAGRYDFTDQFALRGSVQNGFRAPSLQQQYFSSTATNFVGTRLIDVTTFPATDPVALALGSKPLDAEKSVNFSLGSVVRLGKLDVTVDAYRVNINDRIVLSETLNSPAVAAFLAGRGFDGVGGGRFFINGVDTRTKGVDLALTYPFELGSAGKLGATFAANFNSTDVTRVPTPTPPPPPLVGLTPPPVLFDRVNVLSYEDGQPKNKFTAALNWSRNQLGATLRATRYGEALSPDTGETYANLATRPAFDVSLGAKTLVDLEGRFKFADRFNLAIGAENLFDVYPDKNPPGANTTGTASFSNYSPFGRSGRFLYSRFTLDF
jgi:iron complex outermembrane receptor protein